NVLGGKLTTRGYFDGNWCGTQQFARCQAQLASQVEPTSNLFTDAATGDVNRIRNELASQSLDHRIRHVGASAVLCLNCRCTQVRGDNNLWQTKQWRIGAWLSRVHVKACAPVVASLDRIGESLLIDKPAAGS